MKILDDLPSAYDAYPEMIKSLKKEKAEKVTGYYDVFKREDFFGPFKKSL